MGQKNLPVGPARKHVKAFERLGWTVRQSAGGSHIPMTKPGMLAILTIPDHGGEDVKRGLLAKQIALAGVTEPNT